MTSMNNTPRFPGKNAGRSHNPGWQLLDADQSGNLGSFERCFPGVLIALYLVNTKQQALLGRGSVRVRPRRCDFAQLPCKAHGMAIWRMACCSANEYAILQPLSLKTPVLTGLARRCLGLCRRQAHFDAIVHVPSQLVSGGLAIRCSARSM